MLTSVHPAIGVHQLTPDVIQSLQAKHPKPGTVKSDLFLDDTNALPPELVIYESIDADAISNAAKDIDGSGGPTNIDADVWRHMICSKFHLKESHSLVGAIAELTKSAHTFCMNL
ncbi:MAG: hypothetical protein GY782_11440 [Gammaproteobacteria bacterium]|nr:hypothetical protein [Gammaproteobacteria bacterium]